MSVSGSVPESCYGANLLFRFMPLNVLLKMKQMQPVLCAVAVAAAAPPSAVAAKGPPSPGAPLGLVGPHVRKGWQER